MRSLFFGAGVLSVLAMVVIALRAAATLPSSARVPLHLGIGGYGTYVGRTLGLVAWPLVGVVLFLLGALPLYRGGDEVGRWIVLALLIGFPFIEFGAFRSAEAETDRKRRRRR